MRPVDAPILVDAVRAERACGLVTVDYRARSSFSVDSYVREFGFKPLAARWRFIDRKEALGILKRVLARDLAYDTPLMDPARAQVLAERFLSLFSARPIYCTNGSFESSGSAWNPITESTFDRGVVAQDDKGIGIIWVQDED